MKFNLTTAAAGLALLLLAMHMTKKKPTTAGAGTKENPIESGAEWWSYAGSWQ